MMEDSEQHVASPIDWRKHLVLFWTIPCIIFAFLAYMVFHYGVDAPYYDQWTHIPLFIKAQRHELTWPDVWMQHNEHRLVLPNLIMLALANCSGWNIRWEFATSLMIGLGIYAVHALQIKRTSIRMQDAVIIWLLPVIAVATFSLRQYENWLWGFQLQMFLNVFMVTAGFAFLTCRALTWTTLLAALGCGVGATFSFGNGLLYWPLGLGLLLALAPKSQRWQFSTAWIATALLTIAAYFNGYSTPANSPPLYFLHHLIKSVVYFVAYLGSFIGGSFGMYAALGAGTIGIFLFSLATWRLLRSGSVNWKLLMPYWAVASYAIASGFLTVLGRAQASVLFSLTSRYTTISELFWIATLVLTYLWAQQSETGQARHNAALNNPPVEASDIKLVSHYRKRNGQLSGRALGTVTAFGIVFACISILCQQNFQQWHDEKIVVQQRLLTEPLRPDRPELYTDLLPPPWTYVIFRDVPLLKRYHLGIFRDTQAPQRQ